MMGLLSYWNKLDKVTDFTGCTRTNDFMDSNFTNSVIMRSIQLGKRNGYEYHFKFNDRKEERESIFFFWRKKITNPSVEIIALNSGEKVDDSSTLLIFNDNKNAKIAYEWIISKINDDEYWSTLDYYYDYISKNSNNFIHNY